MRIVKEADERRNDILDAAEMLFTSKGYAKTTIIHILEEVGIAKGTFYYYFKSKEEVMDAIIERIIEHDIQEARRITQDHTLNPIQKFCLIIMSQQPQKGDNKDKMIEEFHRPSNGEMHQKSIVQSVTALSPILAQVIQEGNDQGIFKASYPQETVEVLLSSGQVLFDSALFKRTPEETEYKIRAFISIMEVILGAEKGSFDSMGNILGSDNERFDSMGSVPGSDQGRFDSTGSVPEAENNRFKSNCALKNDGEGWAGDAK